MSEIWLKRIALLILILPVGILVLFLFGETFSGDITGLQHLVQLLPLLLVAYLAWKRPFFGGIFLIISSLFLGLFYAVGSGFEVQTIIFAELLLFSPPLISGILFASSSKKEKKNDKN